MKHTERFAMILPAMKRMFSMFRFGALLPCRRLTILNLHFNPKQLSTEQVFEDRLWRVLLASRSKHQAFPMKTYLESFDHGPALHASWVHVCEAANAEPLFIYLESRAFVKDAKS